jgi:hypothetical protein
MRMMPRAVDRFAAPRPAAAAAGRVWREVNYADSALAIDIEPVRPDKALNVVK